VWEYFHHFFGFFHIFSNPVTTEKKFCHTYLYVTKSRPSVTQLLRTNQTEYLQDSLSLICTAWDTVQPLVQWVPVLYTWCRARSFPIRPSSHSPKFLGGKTSGSRARNQSVLLLSKAGQQAALLLIRPVGYQSYDLGASLDLFLTTWPTCLRSTSVARPLVPGLGLEDRHYAPPFPPSLIS
jgi:hypothetical protein